MLLETRAPFWIAGYIPSTSWPFSRFCLNFILGTFQYENNVFFFQFYYFKFRNLKIPAGGSGPLKVKRQKNNGTLTRENFIIKLISIESSF